MNTPMVFKYEMGGQSVVFEGKISIDKDKEIMIQYVTKINGKHVSSYDPRKIKDSASEESYRMRIANAMLIYLQTKEQKPKKKYVSFANDKLVQDYIGETKHLFFSSMFADLNGCLVGDKYVVPLNTKLMKKK